MTGIWCKAIAAGGRGAAFGLLFFACAAQAQDAGSVQDYRLPPASPAPAQGPVDADHPAATPTAPTPPAAPVPEPSPAPRVSLPRAIEPASRTTPEPVQSPAAASPAATVEAPAAEPTLGPAPPETPSASTAPPVAAASPPPLAATPPGGSPDWWVLPLAGAVVLLAVAGFVWLRPKAEAEEEDASWTEPEGEPQAEPATPAQVSGPLEFRFEPRFLRLSFVYATLSYRLELANAGDSPVTGLRIAGDLISGHAALPSWQQLTPGPQELAPLHDLATLAPLASIELQGELQLPLAEVLPLRAGAALYFAPLLRLRLEGQRGGRGALGESRVFALGLPSLRMGDTMQPVRIDLGPMLFQPIEQREIDTARWLQLDEARRTG